MSERISANQVQANAFGAVPVDSGKVSVGGVVLSGGVPYEDWDSGGVPTETGIPEDQIVGPVEDVDQDLVASLVGVDIQVHGLDNRPQAVVLDAGLKDVDEVSEVVVSRETDSSFPEANADEVTGFVGDPVTEEVTEEVVSAKRGPGRPKKSL